MKPEPVAGPAEGPVVSRSRPRSATSSCRSSPAFVRARSRPPAAPPRREAPIAARARRGRSLPSRARRRAMAVRAGVAVRHCCRPSSRPSSCDGSFRPSRDSRFRGTAGAHDAYRSRERRAWAEDTPALRCPCRTWSSPWLVRRNTRYVASSRAPRARASPPPSQRGTPARRARGLRHCRRRGPGQPRCRSRASSWLSLVVARCGARRARRTRRRCATTHGRVLDGVGRGGGLEAVLVRDTTRRVVRETPEPSETAGRVRCLGCRDVPEERGKLAPVCAAWRRRAPVERDPCSNQAPHSSVGLDESLPRRGRCRSVRCLSARGSWQES